MSLLSLFLLSVIPTMNQNEETGPVCKDHRENKSLAERLWSLRCRTGHAI